MAAPRDNTSGTGLGATTTSALRDAIVGLLVGAISLVASVSVAALIFSGPLSPHLARGIGMVLITAVVSGLLVAFSSSCVRSIAIPQDRIAPILAVMASVAAAAMPLSASVEDTFVTIAVMIALTTSLTGLFLIGMGLFRVGGLIRFLPFSVIGGFLAGAGLLLVIGALRVTVNAPLDSVDAVTALFDRSQLVMWLPGLGIAALLSLAARHRRQYLALPLAILLSSILFYGLALTAGLSPQALLDGGWLLGPFDDNTGHKLNLLLAIDWSRVHWGAVFSNFGNQGSVLVITGISILLTVSALELLAHRDLDVNRELRVSGMANLASALSGGMVAFHSLTLSGLSMRLGGKSRLVGLVAALVCAAGLWAGPEPVGYLPRPVIGGLLAYLGFTFLREWLIDAWAKLPKAEYAIIPLIMIAIATSGFLSGLVVGLVAAVMLFVVSYSRVGVVRHAMTGVDRKSTAERHPEDERLLRAHGEAIQVMVLHGYLFFGTTRHLLSVIQERTNDSRQEPLSYVVLDFRHVSGADSSAALSFLKIHQLSELCGFELVLTGLSPGLRRLISDKGFVEAGKDILHYFPDLDHGLEWCENRLLDQLPGQPRTNQSSILQQIAGCMPDAAAQQTFLSHLQRLSVPENYVVVQQGDTSNDLFFVEEGEVSVYLDTGREDRVRIRRTEAGTIIGELGFYLNLPRSASAITDRPATLYRLSAEALTAMETQAPDVAMAFHRFMAKFCSQRLIYTTETLEAMAR